MRHREEQDGLEGREQTGREPVVWIRDKYKLLTTQNELWH